MSAHPQRFRDQLVLGLDEDGLEELTLRIARPDYPDAHRTGRGRDGGIDVLSDLEVPPKRGWQSKNVTSGDVDWTKCRNSLKAGMSGLAPPRHYTFVFPRALRASERNFWRDTFLPEQRRLYPHLETLDYWDDLSRRIESRPELVDGLTDGALSGYIRSTLMQTAATGVNPLASSIDLAEGVFSVAAHAREIGRLDPRFAYSVRGREASAGDADLVDQRVRFNMTRGFEDELPRYLVTLRHGNEIAEIGAEPREGIELPAPEVWFASTAEGEALRAHARAELAKGRPATIEDPAVGLDPGVVPDRFRSFAGNDGVLREGSLTLGLSRPLLLTIQLVDSRAGTVLQDAVQLFGVPAPTGARSSYAGAIGGAVLSLDFYPADPPTRSDESLDVDGVWVECLVTLALALDGETTHDTLRGLGFARFFGMATNIHLDCPGLLPEGGVASPGSAEPHAEQAAAWEVAAKLALALHELSARDGQPRQMVRAAAAADIAQADVILHLLANGGFEIPAKGEFQAPLPNHATLGEDPQAWATVVTELPPFLGSPTNLVVKQTLRDCTPLEIVETPRGGRALRCHAAGENAALIVRLQGYGD